MRLNKATREALAQRIVAVKFDKVKSALEARMKTLANTVYEVLYPKLLQQKMNDLPSGAFASKNVLRINTYEGARRLYFDGFIGTWGHEGGPTARKLLFTHADQAFGLSNNRLLDQVTALWDDIRSYDKERDDQHRRLTATLGQFTTRSALATAWPEAADLLPEEKAERVMLPTVQREELNAMFGLPVNP